MRKPKFKVGDNVAPTLEAVQAYPTWLSFDQVYTVTAVMRTGIGTCVQTDARPGWWFYYDRFIKVKED